MPGPSNKSRIAHNLSLGLWFGGAFFGQIALNPSINNISDRQERGKVLNEAWGRFNAVNVVAIATSVLTWRAGGIKEAAELRAPGLARAKNLMLGGAVVNGILSALLGAGIASQAPGGAQQGDTPVESGLQPGPETPEGAALSQRLISLTGPAALSLLAGAIATSTAIENSAVKPRGALSRLLSG